MRSHRDTNAGGRGAAGGTPPAAPKAEGKRTEPIDTGPLESLIGYALRRAQLAAFEDAIGGFARLDLRPAQYSVLAVIGHRPGLKQSQVAAALGIQRANFVSLIDGLERRGLAQRGAAANDRRSHALHLTDEGQRVLRCANEVVAIIEARLDARLGPGGRAQLLDLLKRLSVRD